ncbi:MAG TPA: type VII secretion EssA family protein [Bacillota bacterium]|nr:type VII secretion EssA family protein [Bacillota bacterium]
MKRWLLSAIVLMFLWSSTSVLAKDNEKPEPNIYEKNKIDYRMNFWDQMEEKEEIPEHQKNLQFNFQEKKDFRDTFEKLTFKPRKTEQSIIYQVSHTGLFSEEITIPNDKAKQEATMGISFVQVVFFISIIIILGMFVILIPKLAKSKK